MKNLKESFKRELGFLFVLFVFLGASSAIGQSFMRERPIKSVTHDAVGPLMPGDTLTVTLRGQPGGMATFNITNVVMGAPMEEVSPGMYQGSYTITQQRSIVFASVTGHLKLHGRDYRLGAIKGISVGGSSND